LNNLKIGDKVVLRSKTLSSCSSVIDEVRDIYENKNEISLKGYPIEKSWFKIDNGFNQWIKVVEIK